MLNNLHTALYMKISYDPAKRQATFTERGLDFEDAFIVFAGKTIEYQDNLFDYGEERIISIGLLYRRMVVLVWTLRGAVRHIISMMKANVKEQKYYGKRLSKS